MTLIWKKPEKTAIMRHQKEYKDKLVSQANKFLGQTEIFQKEIEEYENRIIFYKTKI